jgi:hemolysin activation/secretion protein
MATNRLPGEARLFVRDFNFEGNRAFSDAELGAVAAPFKNRELGSDEIEQARRAITVHYVQHGYVNSGAVIPDQDPTNGIVTLRIIEGRVSQIKLEGNEWFTDRHLLSRLQLGSAPPLNLNKLQEGLQLLRQDPNMRQINAELKPGIAPGESLLEVKVKDEQPFRVGLQIDNQRPPSVGAGQLSLLASVLNLSGHSDPLHLRYGILNSGEDQVEFSELDNLEGSYLLPLNRYETAIGIHGSRLNTRIGEAIFESLDITSLTESYGVFLRQPIYRTVNHEVAISAGFDHRVNNTWLLDEPFSISPGAVNGEMVVSVLRVSQEWLWRGRNHVLALRSTFNFGLDAWDATDNGVPGDPDATFFYWLGQAQYVQRLFKTQNQVVLRLSGQWTDEPLLALEQFSVGGFNTVRGYLENQLVRDRGVVSSIEFRVPVLFDKSGAGTLHLAPFFDFGGAWNESGAPGPSTICSTGLGVLYAPNKHLSAEVYWGYRFRDVDMPEDAGLQDHGLSLKINLMAF